MRFRAKLPGDPCVRPVHQQTGTDMKKTITYATLLAATLGLAACGLGDNAQPSRIGGQSSAPGAQAGGNAGAVGGGDNSTHSNGTGGGTNGGTGGNSSGSGGTGQ